MMSSRVTSPAVPPYSSMTMAMWKRSLLHLPQQVGHPLGLGHEVRRDGPARATGSSSWPSRSARIRSLACTMPTTSSMPSPQAGIRL